MRSKFGRYLFLLALLATVSGQIFAYPLNCSMAGMVMPDVPALSISATLDQAGADASGRDELTRSGTTQLDILPDCERICGYCLSFNFPTTEKADNAVDYRSSATIAFRPSFYLNVLLESPFRPPNPA